MIILLVCLYLASVVAILIPVDSIGPNWFSSLLLLYVPAVLMGGAIVSIVLKVAEGSR